MDNVVDAVTACARDPTAAFAWITHVEQDATTFEELGNVLPQWVSLDAKIRVAMTRHTTGSHAEQHKELVSNLTRRRDELKRASMPTQISGRQLLWIVRHYFQIHEKERVQYELSALIQLEYPGDSQMGPFKDRLDHMFRHCRTNLSDRDKEGILVAKLRKSEELKPHLEYYDRMPEGHADRSFTWVSQLIDQVIADKRRRRNTESLILDASGKPQTPKKPTAPGPKKEPKAPPPKSGNPGGGGNPSGPATKSPKKEGKGSGKSDKDKAAEKAAWDEFKKIPESDRCCLYYLWKDAKGFSRCNRGESCPHGHKSTPSKAVMGSKIYAIYAERYGERNGPGKLKPKTDKKSESGSESGKSD